MNDEAPAFIDTNILVYAMPWETVATRMHFTGGASRPVQVPGCTLLTV